MPTLRKGRPTSTNTHKIIRIMGITGIAGITGIMGITGITGIPAGIMVMNHTMYEDLYSD